MKVLAALVALVSGALLLTCSGFSSQPTEPPIAGVGGRTPVVFVSGVTGTKLQDPLTSALIWGSVRVLIRPRDGGYSLALPLDAADASGEETTGHPQARYQAIGPIWKLRFPAWTKEVYRPLRKRFEEAGFRLGDLEAPGPADDLFFFNYDWRYGNLDSVRRLDRQLTALSESRDGTEVDLVCQSNAAKICRWLAKYGALSIDEAEAGVTWQHSYRIRKLVLAGVSNSGALRVLQLLIRGRNYVPLVGRRLYPETFFSIRQLYEDLPAERDDLFFDENGEILSVDLFDAQNWLKYGWSIFGHQAVERLRRDSRSDLFGDREKQLAFLQRQLENARRLQSLLARDSGQFPTVSYFLLENDSLPTIDRALLTQKRGEWRTYFLGDRQVDGDPALERLAAAPGDGHAVLDSQRGLSSQESEVLEESVMVAGKHFEAIIQPEALDAILEFLLAPAAAP